MKHLSILTLFIVSSYISNAQEAGSSFPAAEFTTQIQKLVCDAKSNFADATGKQIIIAGDTSWKSNITLPGFKSANLGKGKSFIDLAFVAYQKFTKLEDAQQYYVEVKKALDQLPSGTCLKLEPARIPMGVKGVEQYDLWKSTTSAGYTKKSSALLYVSLNLDKENEVVINLFLR